MKCCICGAVKNCGPYLRSVFKNMEAIGSLFDKYVIILAYDHSNDGSLSIIKEYIKNNPGKVYLYVNNNKLSIYRTHNIANARNKCMDLIKEKFADYEYFIMMDCDDVCSKAAKTDIVKSYLDRDDWDSLSFNKNPYYDEWAFSKYPFVLSCHHFYSTVKWGRFIKKQFSNAKPGKLIPCLSAFNGFAIYRTQKFIDCVYDGRMRLDLFPPNFIVANFIVAGKLVKKKYNSINEDCEHRSFHMQAINKHQARIMIAPEIVF
jgi:glycosyltransferase involved in cell wall biosynthesis